MERQIAGLNIQDRDMFIDLKVGSEKEINNLYAANLNNMIHEEHVFANLNHSKLPEADGQAPFKTLIKS